MASIYVPIRIALIVLTGISLILGIIDLVQLLNKGVRDTQAITSLVIMCVVLFIGAYGSYKNDRTYLFTFALILIVAIIVGFTSSSVVYAPLGLNIFVAILAATQGELIRRGYA